MTNTRMTDPEVFELRYPVVLEQFGIRRGSGGAGRSRGGDGSVRRIRFEEKMTVVVVASRREVAPFGLEGGADGAVGRQWVERGGVVETMTGRSRAELAPGDVFVIETPGAVGSVSPPPSPPFVSGTALACLTARPIPRRPASRPGRG